MKTNQHVTRYIRSLNNLKIYTLFNKSGQIYFDVIPKNTNKLIAAKVWCKENNININRVLAVGNNINDYELIKGVGYGVAMNNSPYKIKRISKLVIRNKSDNGLQEFIEDTINA